MKFDWLIDWQLSPLCSQRNQITAQMEEICLVCFTSSIYIYIFLNSSLNDVIYGVERSVLEQLLQKSHKSEYALQTQTEQI